MFVLDFYHKIVKYITKDVWKVDHNRLPKAKQLGVKSIKIALIAINGYQKDQCSIRSSALTFFSILSIVPVLAMAFAIAQGFGLENILQEQIVKNFEGQEQVINYLLEFSHSMLRSTKGGMIAGIGVILLLWSVLKLLNNIENAFNIMWDVKKPRTWVRKFSDYLTIVVTAPILLVLAGSLTVYIKTALQKMTENNELVSYASPFILMLLKYLPYLLIWFVFTLLYKIMPNTKVSFSAAMIAGIIAGSAYQIFQWLYITFQVGVAKYNAIYGSFAALPLFLMWMEISWLMVLFGAELAFAIQNIDKYSIQEKITKISHNYRQKLALLIVQKCVKRFANGEKPLTSDELSKTLKIPLLFVKKINEELIETNILSAVKTDKENVFAYQPAVDINRLTIKYIIDAIDCRGNDIITVAGNEEYQKINDIIEKFHKNIKTSDENILIKDL